MHTSYVFGNSPHLLQLTARERTRLDQSPSVAVLNGFPPHWRLAGFRPTVWIVGDCYDAFCRDLLRERMTAAAKDPALFQRLHTLFLCPETLDGGEADMKALIHSIRSVMPTVTVRLYNRGHWEDTHQTIATAFDQPMLHRGSSLTDAINIMALLNPNQPVRIAGCPYKGPQGYFYETPAFETTEDALALSAKSRLLMWDAFVDMRRQGIYLLDCNRHHGGRIPPALRLPRARLFPEDSFFARFRTRP